MNEPKEAASRRRLVAVHELAMILGVKDSWIYDRTRQGHSAIPFIKLGAYVRFDAEEVISFFKIYGDASIINHRKMETATENGFSDNARSGKQIQAFDRLPTPSSNQQDHQGAASDAKQKKYHLVDR